MFLAFMFRIDFSRVDIFKLIWRWFVLLGIVVLVNISWINSSRAVIYIDKDSSGGNGSSWQTAYKSIGEAIAENGNNEDFWIAEGIYTPSNTLSPKPGSKFYGGFRGDENQLEERDFNTYSTIIDGQNTLKHVFFLNTLAENVRIDGFTIKRGAASSSSGWDGYGGGIFVDQQTVVISNCIFTDNTSSIMGGAITVNRAPANIENSIFQNNSAGNGGAIAGYGSELTISGCTFDSNIAVQNGGALYNDNEVVDNELSSSISTCTFTKNTSATQGGAISINRIPGNIQNCNFQFNASERGGALAGFDSDLKISECRFESNHADRGTQPRGAAIWVNLQSPEIRNTIFSGNSANHSGGGIELNNTPNAIISGCNFLNNSAGQGGGGLSTQWDETSPRPSAMIDKCLFQGNSSGLEGGGIYSYYFELLIRESRFHNNTGVNGGALMLDYKLSGDSKVSRMERCLFMGNSATSIGGAVRSYARSVEIENSVFGFNFAPDAGAIGLHAGENEHYDPYFTAILRNCSFYGNSATGGSDLTGYGGALVNSFVPMLYIYNSIFWGNQGVRTIWDELQGKPVGTHDVFNASSSSMTTRYSDMETLDWEHGSVSENHTGSFSSDPQFVDPEGDDNTQGTLDDNFRLRNSSPCIDRADGDNAPEFDVEFNARFDLLSKPNLGVGTPNYGDIGSYETIRNSTIISPILPLLLE